MKDKEALEYYKKAYLREKEARKEAERILEFKAQELYTANEKLTALNITLEENLEKRIEQIRKAEEAYRQLVESANDIIFSTDSNGHFTYVNPKGLLISGYSSEELIGLNFTKLIVEEFRKKAILIYQNQMINKESDSYFEYDIVSKKGERISLGQNVKLIFEKGVATGFLSIARDITAQKKLQNDLEEANQIAQASAKAKERFLANMSHEMRTPLNAVIGLSNLLKETDLKLGQIDYVTKINSAAGSLLMLVNDILDLSKIESGKLELNEGEFVLRKSLNTILSSASYQAQEKELKLRLSIDEKLDKSYVGDELRLCQILINLTNNAIKFTTFGGVHIQVKLIDEQKTHHRINIAVTDTGKGIAPEALERIFEDFNQENASISTEYGGTGLGLSISQNLVEVLGGQLKVDSILGEGATFHFNLTLQRIDQSAEKATKKLPKKRSDWNNVTILVVEDNEVNQFVVKETIQTWGGTTDIASDGREAINWLMKKTYDLILMDMRMPVMDGIETTTYIRRQLKLQIPIIAFTANAMKQEREHCFAIGMNDYVAKPFQKNELKQKIEQFLPPEKIMDKSFEEPSKEIIVEPIFTLERLEALSQGNPDFISRLLTIFKEDTEEQLTLIKKTNDADELSQIAHKMKPSIDYISNEHVKQLIRKIEAKDFVKDARMLIRFEAVLEELLVEVTKVLESK